MQFSAAITFLLSLSSASALAAPAPTPPAALDARGNGASCNGISPASASRVQASFSSAGVVPTLIPSIEPQIAVNVQYGSKAVDLGNTFAVLETALPPTYSLSCAQCDTTNTTYSLFLVDPDVPSPNGVPVVGLIRLNYLHWEVSGITIASGTGNTVVFYQTPTPASVTPHRYTFLVYREPAGYMPQVLTPNLRAAFDVNGYAAAGGLELVGGNFFHEGLLST